MDVRAEGEAFPGREDDNRKRFKETNNDNMANVGRIYSITVLIGRCIGSGVD